MPDPDELDPPLAPKLLIFSSVKIVQLTEEPLTVTFSFVLPCGVRALHEPADVITVPAIRVSGLVDEVDEVWLVDLRQPVAAAMIKSPLSSAGSKRE